MPDQYRRCPCLTGYLEPAGAELLPHRAPWQLELPPPQFLTAVARLRRLVTACPDAEITQTEDPWMWTATLPPVSTPGEPVRVTGADLTGLADELEAAVARRTSAVSALETLRSNAFRPARRA